ncbi:ABC transporter ATP-binding protein [Paracoccus aestuarii]|uniref:ABC transporter ATP-binding protein n=1 Tax=Paracoccus aestuarii TaxID=453842 RepID=A0A418ZXI6_9RHOB|nr:ABC transporter ATP-binding protein [Paracoccus aestuarii]RJL05223.1 ABC transporter ATP-binding protein [Paracoccus aestuarii]WCQ99171.1 ABC transporter ATP-binding protein [Paracoccus aestuarii]
MTADTPVLDLRELSIRFKGQPIDLIDRVSLSIRPGRTLALVGESGCGKSVTSLAAMGLLPKKAATVTHGQVLFRGEDLGAKTVTQMEALRGNRMAMIFQEPMTSLNPVFTIGDQVAEAVRRHRGCSRDAARARALEMFRLVRMPAAEKRMDDYPHQLSGGMRQRVMIAMALANDPELLIADEPTTALDVTIQAQILDLMRELLAETGAAMLMITHDLGVVAEIADDVAVMYAGRVVETGPVGAIFGDPQHPYTIGLMGSMPALAGRAQGASRLMTIPGSVPVPEAMPPGCRFASRCPFASGECDAGRPDLRALGPGHAAACIKAPLEAHFAKGAA